MRWDVSICTSVFLTVVAGQDLQCDFENGYCGWFTPPSADGNWTRHQFEASSSGQTGPETGNTLPTPNYYIYLDPEDFKDGSNVVVPGQTCMLRSPPFDSTPAGGCFRFYYHMYGTGVGSLTAGVVGANQPGGTWRKDGSQNDTWTCGFINIGENENGINIELVAYTGANILGIIALDDLRLYVGRCSTIPDPCRLVDPTTTISTTNSISASSGTSPTPVAITSASVTLSTSPQQDTTLTSSSEEGLTLTTLLYIILIPVAVLVVGGIIACICYRRNREKDVYPPPITRFLAPNRDSTTEEVYDDLDEHAMREFDDERRHAEYHEITQPDPEPYLTLKRLPQINVTDSGDQNLPNVVGANGFPGLQLPVSKEDAASVISNDSYLAPVSPEEVDTVSVGSGENYIEPVAGPEERGRDNPGFVRESADLVRHNDDIKGSVGGGRAPNSTDVLSVPGVGVAGGRYSPPPDYDDDGGQTEDYLNMQPSPPKQCGPTNAYITAVPSSGF